MPTPIERIKAIAGAALIGLGILFCYDNLHQVATYLSLPAIVLAAFRFFQAYASDHHRFLQFAFRQMVVTFWPLLLIVAGTVLSQDCPVHDRNRISKPSRSVDLSGPRSTSKQGSRHS